MIAVLGLTTVYVVATASADGRALTGDYCTTPTGVMMRPSFQPISKLSR